MKYISLTLPIFFLSILTNLTNLTAQDIQHIRKQYSQYTAQISDCQDTGDECSLYCNTQTTNSLNQVWRGVGEYKSETKFWYDDNPSHCDECGIDGINVLKMVTSETYSSLVSVHEEWLFSEGKLIFYYLKTIDEDTDEYRHYYEGDTLILYKENGISMAVREVSEKYLEGVKLKVDNLQKSFLLSFI